jgi:galacturan 1,4-alpha-galacturonidase
MKLCSAFFLPLLAISVAASPPRTCVVKPGGNSSVDDAPAILEAFETCGHDGRVTFLNTTYHINSVMTTVGLKNVDVDLQGTLLVS